MKPTYEMRRLWRAHEDNMRKMRFTAFELLTHPDSTHEDIERLRVSCRNAMQRHHEAKKLMHERGIFGIFFAPAKDI